MQWRISGHARVRMGEMSVGVAEVEEVLRSPETTYPCDPSYGAGRAVWTHGRLALVVNPTDAVVITVLWNRLCGRSAA